MQKPRVCSVQPIFACAHMSALFGLKTSNMHVPRVGWWLPTHEPPIIFTTCDTMSV